MRTASLLFLLTSSLPVAAQIGIAPDKLAAGWGNGCNTLPYAAT